MGPSEVETETRISQTFPRCGRRLATGAVLSPANRTKTTKTSQPETCSYKAYIVFRYSMKQIHHTIQRQDIQKWKGTCVPSQLHWETAKLITPAYQNNGSQKTFASLSSCDETWWQIDLCTSNNSQKHFYFEWDGHSLAPGHYGAWEGTNILHQPRNIFSLQTSN